MSKVSSGEYLIGNFSKYFGVKILIAKTGYSKIELPLNESHMNILNIPHGGTIFSLADISFGIAVNYGEPVVTITANASITYIKQASKGPLFAEAQVIHKGRKLVTCAVEINDGNNDLIATATLNGYRTSHAQSSIRVAD